MIAIIVLSVVLYARCFQLLVSLHRARRELRRLAEEVTSSGEVTRLQHEIAMASEGQRIPLRAMIAAAPLLGLLGTVRGMSATFENLAASANGKSMEGLAQGISEVLVSTESGLLVALPAMALLWFAHRQTARCQQHRSQPPTCRQPLVP